MEHWWSSHLLVLGVFQGGGAKGVAYAGALRALDERGIWFSQVAGASAGAITAVLIAAGVHPSELDATTRSALASVTRRAARLALGFADTLFSTSELGSWLDQELRRRVRGVSSDQDGPGVSFAELEHASGTACHVVALDLATGHPIVFSAATTPDAPVVEAVLASSAIPGALRGGRAVVRSESQRAVVHHLVDGGTWANYPSFVFRDPVFRRWAGLDCDEVTGLPLVGLSLDSSQAPPPAVGSLLHWQDGGGVEYDLGAGRSSRSPLAFSLSWLLGSRLLRLTMLVATLGVGAVLIEDLPEIALDWQEVAMRSAGPAGPVIATAGTAVVYYGMIAVGLVAIVLFGFGRMLAHSAAPSANALLGVATRVPPWAHADPNAILLRLDSLGVKTTAFELDEKVREPLVRNAHADAAQQLAEQRERLLAWGADAEVLTTADQDRPAREANAPDPQEDLEASDPTAIIASLAMAAFCATALWWASTAMAEDDRTVFSGIIVWLIGSGLLAFRNMRSSARRRALGEPARSRFVVWASVAVIAAFAAASLAVASSQDRSSFDAEIVSARATGAGAVRYGWVALEDATRHGTVVDPVKLAIGEQARVDRGSDEGWRLARDAGRTPAAVAAVLGLTALAVLIAVADASLYRRFRQRVHRAAM